MEAAGVGKKDSFARSPNLEFIRILLDHGADPTIKDKTGRAVVQKLPMPGTRDVNAQKVWRMLAIHRDH
jgi:hypothetical protein